MDPSTWRQIETILDQILPLGKSERTRYIEEYVDNPELKKEIHALLEAELKAPQFLDKGVEALLTGEYAIHDLAENISGKTFEIDRYRVEKEIGRGGMSVVYLAHRTDGEFNQNVAVKIIQPFGIDREDRFRRLRSERQILANLQHPNIARVFDGGITSEGWPYMVMELVDGIPLTQYCKENNLDLNDRLKLFLKICDAVSFAHRNLVVHRDLKPGNILVTTSGDVKLLDFGIAKLLENDGGSRPLTQTGIPILTPEYAAPEQFKREPVTTLVDLYSLGIILYELLTDSRPFDLSKKSIADMEQIVFEEEPVMPSEKTSRNLDSDLDVICMKALMKEPAERYRSVQEMKEDLILYMQGLPILAQPASFFYRTRKFATRNRTLIGAAAVVFAIFSSFILFHISQITEQRNIAQLEAEKANRIKDFTTNLFISNNPYSLSHSDEGITLREVLENGLQTVESELADDPEIYAEMNFVMGHALSGLGNYDTAQLAAENALAASIERHGNHHTSVAANLSLLGRINGIRGNYEEAINLLDQALEMNRSLYGDPSSAVAVNLAEIARVYSLKRDFNQALEIYQESLAMHETIGQDETLDYNQTLSELVEIQTQMRMIDDAETNLRRVMDNYRKIVGENHLNMAFAYSKLAQLQYQKSDFNTAEENIKRSLEIHEQLSGPRNPNTITTHNFAGALYRQMGNYPKSEWHLQQAIGIHREYNSTDSLSLTTYLNNLALTKASMGQLDSASVLHEQVLQIRQRLLPPDNSSITISMYNLASLHHQMGNFQQAKELFELVVERDKRSLGKNHPEVAIDLVKLAAVYRDLGDFSIAENAFREAEVIFSERFPEDHYRLGEFYREYGRLKMMQNQSAEALDYLNKSMAIFKQNYDDDHSDIKSVEKFLSALAQGE